MCGIAGIVKQPGAAVERPLLQRMIGMVNHRGPDAVGFHLSGSVGLAHARLSIIDLGGGHQPMSNEDKTIWITFNGEIFNYVELREDLIKKGEVALSIEIPADFSKKLKKIEFIALQWKKMIKVKTVVSILMRLQLFLMTLYRLRLS